MPVSVILGRPVIYPVAGCTAIDQMLRETHTALARVELASATEIDKKYIRMSDALAAQHSLRSNAVDALKKARGETGAQLLRLAGSALMSTADLFLVIAVQTRNPQLIAAATGVDLAIDTGAFVIQVISAHDNTRQQDAAVSFLKGRAMMIETLVSGPGATFSKRRFAVMKATADVMVEMGQAVLDEARLKARLTDAKQALAGIEASIAGMPVNSDDMRAYLSSALRAELFLLNILKTEYSGTGCRIDGNIGPA